MQVGRDYSFFFLNETNRRTVLSEFRVLDVARYAIRRNNRSANDQFFKNQFNRVHSFVRRDNSKVRKLIAVDLRKRIV